MTTVSPRRSKQVLAAVAVVAIYWMALFVATHIPVRTAPRVDLYSVDKYQHLSAYGLLAVLVCSAAMAWKPCPWRLSIYVFLLIGLYGMIDEITQRFVAHRTPDPFDWLADMAGAALGIGLFWLGRNLLKHFFRSQSPAAPHGNRGI